MSRQLMEYIAELEHERLTLHRSVNAKDAAIEILKEKVKKQKQKLKEWNKYFARSANSRTGAGRTPKQLSLPLPDMLPHVLRAENARSGQHSSSEHSLSESTDSMPVSLDVFETNNGGAPGPGSLEIISAKPVKRAPETKSRSISILQEVESARQCHQGLDVKNETLLSLGTTPATNGTTLPDPETLSWPKRIRAFPTPKNGGAQKRQRQNEQGHVANQVLNTTSSEGQASPALSLAQSEAVPTERSRRITSIGLRSQILLEKLNAQNREGSETSRQMQSNDEFRNLLQKSPPKILTPVDKNTRMLPKCANAVMPVSKKRKSNNGHGVAAISAIAEDGEEKFKIHEARRKRYDASTGEQQRSIDAQQRLANLLAAPPPVKEKFQPPKEAVDDMREFLDTLHEANLIPQDNTSDIFRKYQRLCTADLQNLQVEKGLAGTANKSAKPADYCATNAVCEWYETAEALLLSLQLPCPSRLCFETLKAGLDGHSATSPVNYVARLRRACIDRNIPMRGWPIQALRIDEFSINPEVNGGLEYAYSEVVRGYDRRDCLPACMGDECCGPKFRALAKALDSADNDTYQRKLLLPQDFSLLDGKHAEEELARNYTPRPSPTIPLTPDTQLEALRDHKEILEVCKARLLAEKYGKQHRHVYQRARSPPGFWRSDFPTDEELVRDALKEYAGERAEVKRRWAQAARPDGKGIWKFLDEMKEDVTPVADEESDEESKISSADE